MVRGRLQTGLGEGRFITELDWVKEQIIAKLGFEPVPGTFNVQVVYDDLSNWQKVDRWRGIKIIPPSPVFVVGKCFHVQIGDYRGAIVRPMLDDYPANLAEVVSPVYLREAMGLRDGDEVALRIFPFTAKEAE